MKDMMDAEIKLHAPETLNGPHSLSGHSQGSEASNAVDDEPQEQEESEDEIDPPKTLRR